MKKLIGFLVALLAIFFFAKPAFADSLIFDRGLPNTHLNNDAGSERSNVAWSYGDNDHVSGDDFTLGTAGEKWVVTGIRTWGIGRLATLSDEFTNIKLYAGTNGLTLLPGVVIPTAVTYSNGQGYQSTSGEYRHIWQLDFTSLNWVIDGGTKYYFAVNGTPTGNGYSLWFNHASNAALSGTPQQGADNKWISWLLPSLPSPIYCNSSGGSGECDGGWDKTSDINVQVFAHKVPANDNGCKKGGWESFGFKNQGQCVRFVETGKDSR